MPATLREMPQEGIELIKSFEGIPDGDPGTVNLDAYLDPLDIWTIGWGHALLSHGVMVRGAASKALARSMFPGGISLAQAETLLRADLVSRTADVLRLVQAPLSDNQFGAIMSFVFNCGGANFAGSTLLKLLNAGHTADAADQFLAWNKGRKNGVLVELPGLTRRRRAERAQFLGQDWRAVAATPLGRSRSLPASGVPAREVPMAPTPGEAAAARKALALVQKPVPTPRGRTTTSTGRQPAPPAAHPGRRTAK